ncbi:MAG: ArsR/SmtB family transcription factor [Elainellaceae cyanobacterium]
MLTQQDLPAASATTPEGATSEGCCIPVSPLAISEAQAQEYAAWFKALADPTRIRILSLLTRHAAPLCVCDIVSHFDLGQPAISHHLKVLRDAGFVTAMRQANFMYYSVDGDCLSRFPQAAHLIMDL